MSDLMSEVASQSPTAVAPHKVGIVIPETIQSSKDFRDWVASLEPTDRLLEYIEGRIVEKMACNSQASGLTIELATDINIYVRNTKAGFVTGSDAGYQVGDENYIPDIGVILGRKRRDVTRVGYNPFPPDLAVEVLSSDSKVERETLAAKIKHYIAAGATVWAVDEFKSETMVYYPNGDVKRYAFDDILHGDPLLPGFQVRLSDLI